MPGASEEVFSVATTGIMEISQPSVLTRLPHSSGNNGRSLFAQVHGIRNGVKRKRQEICAVIDGNSVSIYEAQYGRTVSSIPIPPETTFECAPCSLRSRSESGTARSTYCVVKRRSEIYLQCFTETVSEPEAKQHLLSAKLASNRGRIVQVEYMSWSHAVGVLVVWESGYYNLFTPDLSTQLSEGQLTLPDNAARLLACHCTTVSDASRTVLKARPDLTAGVNAEAIVIAAVVQSSIKTTVGQQDLRYCLWQLPVATSSASGRTSFAPALSHILKFSSPFDLRDKNGVVFLSKGTKISIQSRTMTALFELTSTIPQKVSELPLLVPDHISSLMVSDYLSLFSSSGGLCMYNTQFRSIQASLDLSRGTLKRRRNDQPSGPITFIAYFPQLNRVIGNRRGHLVAVDLSMSQSTDINAAMKRSSMLINNIGKGSSDHGSRSSSQIQNTSLGNIRKSGISTDTWSSTSKRLEECLSKQNIDGFEELFLQHVTSLHYSEDLRSELRSSDAEVTYVLPKVLQSTGSVEGSIINDACTLTVVLPARRILHWLATEGHLNANRIMRALSASSKMDVSRQLRPGSIVYALFNFDPSLSAMMQFLSEAPYLDLQNLCAAVKILIRKALIMSDSPVTLALEASRSTTDIDNPAKAPEDVPPSTVSVADVSTILIRCLERLSNHDSQMISANLRSELEQEDLIALIQFLRQQLFQNGYTRSVQSQTYPSPPPSINGIVKDTDIATSVESGLSLDTILSIVSCCVDVIGPLGLVSTGGDMQFIQTLIPELLSEITRTMEALDDASYLQGLLRETLRYSTSLGDRSSKTQESSEGTAKPVGTITTLYAESGTSTGAIDTSTLPLSLHAENKLNAFKVRKGGGQVSKRSQREMGMLQDRLRGPYALERLVL